MILHKTYYFALISVLVTYSCKTKEDVASTAPSREVKLIEPDQVKPDIDTRFQAKFFEAQKEKAIGNTAKAYKLFDECLSIEPGSGVVHYELARMDAAQSDMNGAIDHAKKAVAVDPLNPWYHLLLGDVYYQQQKFDLAFKEYSKVAELNPQDPNIVYDQANALLSAGRLHEAIDMLDQLEAREGISEELSLQKHQLYVQEGKLELAGRELEGLAKAFPLNPKYWGMLAQFYQRTGQGDKALQALESLRNCDPQNGQVHMQLSDFYASTGEDEKSYNEMVLAFGSTDVPIDHKIGILLRFFNATQIDPSLLSKAYELLDLTQKTHPNEAKSFSIYGDFLNRDKRFPEARDKYRRAVELDPTRSAIWSELLLLDSQLAQWNDLESDSRRALDFFPVVPEYYYYNGIANQRLKKYDVALSSLKSGKELVIENDRLLSQFYSSLGEVYNTTRDFVNSDASYEQSIELDPNDVFTLNNYAYYLSLRKAHLERAAEMSKRCNELDPNRSSFEDTYAWILYQQENYTEALKWIQKALEHGASTNGEVVEHFGDILFMSGNKEKAIEQWKIAASLEGASDLIQRKIAEEKIVN